MEVIELPPEIINYIIYNFLGLCDIYSCMMTCKKFNILEDYQVYNLMISSGRGWEYCIEQGLMGSSVLSYSLTNKFSKKNKIDIHSNGEALFIQYCKFKSFTTCKRLYDFSLELGSPIDIRAVKDSAFFVSCEVGNLETSKWLYSLFVELSKKHRSSKPIDINRYYPILYPWCASRNYSEMCRWFEEIKNQPSTPITWFQFIKNLLQMN